MRTALVIIAFLVSAVFYHRHVVMSLNDQLQAEIGSHAVTAGKLKACQSGIRAECEVARAQEGKADAREALGSLIKERRR